MTNSAIGAIRGVKGGFIVLARWPYGPVPGGYGEVVCNTIEEVLELVRKCLLESDEHAVDEAKLETRRLEMMMIRWGQALLALNEFSAAWELEPETRARVDRAVEEAKEVLG